MSTRRNDLTLTPAAVERELRNAAYISPPHTALRKAYYRPKTVGGEATAKLIMRRWAQEYIAEYNDWVDTYHGGDRDKTFDSTPTWLRGD